MFLHTLTATCRKLHIENSKVMNAYILEQHVDIGDLLAYDDSR